ncbi:hypothetical protein LXA47_32555 [Massilia sp. P8910]|uniref:hypothetical protein n=1 Tax=Massilia antarctica TaxID=2765360 RepID=UPI001E4BFDAA|nr:hypothetical protein [Massilia antarctica]MCE3608301.1 hypothetical protein [Massilia antarctica]
MANEKKVIDWDLVEKDLRAGIKTKQQMATEHGVSRAAMDKRFAKLNIARHLGGKIRAKAASIVEQSVVPATAQPLSPAREREIVEVNAAMQSQIILSHRADIQRTRRLSMQLLEELEVQTDHADLFRDLAAILCEPDEKGANKRLELFEKVMSLNSRAGTMKTLADALRSLIAMERQAFGLDDKKEDEVGTGVEDVIKRVMAKNGGA